MTKAGVKTKAQAEELFARGRLSEALTAYEALAEAGQADPRVHLRMGDISRRLDDIAGAIRHYNDASMGFARLGFAIKAIAVLKLILHLDPGATEARSRLAGLYALQTTPAHEQPGGGEYTGHSSRDEKEARKLPKAPLFSDFTEEEFGAVVSEVSVRGLEPGEYLFRAGDHGGSIFFVAEGSVEVVFTARGRTGIVLATLNAGEVFGEFGFFSNSLRSAGVRAATPAEVLELKRTDLEELIKRHGRIEAVLFEFYKVRVIDRLMATSSVFSPLSPSERTEMLRGVEPREFKAGEKVVTEGEPGDVMYLIKEGRVSVSAGGPSGTGVEVTELKAGDFFGEVALATERPRVASVTAVTDVSLAEFSRKAVRAAARAHPEIKEALGRVIKERVYETTRAARLSGTLV